MQMSKVERSHDTNNLVIVAVLGEAAGGGGGGAGGAWKAREAFRWKKEAFIGLTYLLKF